MAAKKKTSTASKVLYNRLYKNRPQRISDLEQSIADSNLGIRIHRLRQEEGLTQAELAEKIGTTASVISRIEDADYDGHSVETLRRIAKALKRRLDIRFVEEPEKVHV